MAAMIGIDWGTTSFRAWLIAADGEAIDLIEGPDGILSVPAGDFDSVFEARLRPWLHHDLPIIASGMITSQNGWVETPYLPLPLDIGALAAALVPHRSRTGRAIHFVTGAISPRPDVMRGEETEIVGHLAGGGDNGLFVLPGTHSKWAWTSGDKITDFRTFMTGEVFALLRSHSILGRLAEDGPFAADAFVRGLGAAGEEGAFTSRIFSARVLALLERLGPREVGDYLSGLLIGEELRAGLGQATGAVTIIGRGDLAARYRIAFETLGITAGIAAPGMARLGQWQIARHAGLIP